MELRNPDNYYGVCLGTLSFTVWIVKGGMQITNTYFRQQPANQRRDSDCLQYLKYDRFIERVLQMTI